MGSFVRMAGIAKARLYKPCRAPILAENMNNGTTTNRSNESANSRPGRNSISPTRETATDDRQIWQRYQRHVKAKTWTTSIAPAREWQGNKVETSTDIKTIDKQILSYIENDQGNVVRRNRVDIQAPPLINNGIETQVDPDQTTRQKGGRNTPDRSTQDQRRQQGQTHQEITTSRSGRHIRQPNQLDYKYY